MDRFLNVPDELLLVIAEVLYDREQKKPIKRAKFRATWALSLVNRRWRNIVLPLLFRKLKFKRMKKFVWSITGLAIFARNERVARTVRSVCIRAPGIPPQFWEPVHTFPNCLTLPLPNLTEFECTTMILEELLLGTLGRFPRLTSLSIVCKDVWPTTLLEKLSKLRTLRLRPAFSSQRPITGTFERLTYTSITTLALQSRLHSDLVKTCLSDCNFPNLRVFVISSCPLHPLVLFRFVHRHSALQEVNVDITNERLVSVEAVLKLIEGTGTWFEYDSTRDAPNSTDHPDIRTHYDGDSIFSWPSHSLFAGRQTTCKEFAFTRQALDQSLPPWRSRMGSLYPRYKCTALALRRLNVSPDDYNLTGESAIAEALQQIALMVPHVEELRLKIDDSTEFVDRMQWMESFRKFVQNLPYLRTLTLHWHYSGTTYEPRWRPTRIPITYDRDNSPAEDRLMPFLDYAVPPTWIVEWGLPLCYSRHSPPILGADDELHSWYRDINPCVDDVINVLSYGSVEEIDEEDYTLPMRAWTVHNESDATCMVRQLALACPSLETFDWYISDSALFHREQDCSTVLWRWEIRRNESLHARKPIQLFGDLQYDTRFPLGGDPSPFYPLVGQELERTLLNPSRYL